MLVHDIPHRMSIILRMLNYLSPVVYFVSYLPERYPTMCLLNPIAVSVRSCSSCNPISFSSTKCLVPVTRSFKGRVLEPWMNFYASPTASIS